MSTMRARSILLLLLAAGGCSGSDDPSVDGPIADATEDVSIVGSWTQRLPQGEPQDIGHIDELVFREDGTLTVSGQGPGTYELRGAGRLRLRADGATNSRETDYARRDEWLLLDALRPVGAVNGFVGDWRGVEVFVVDGETREVEWRLVLRDDGTAHFSESGVFDRDGTWERHVVDGRWVRFQATDGGGALGMWIASLGEGALGRYAFTKLD
jgi:hypothetical protein